MKKVFAIMLALAVVLGLAACGLSKQPEETAAKAFKAGVWAVVENGAETGATYTFTDSMKECSYDNGATALGFDYEISGDSYIFHMGSADDNSSVKAVFADDENCTLTWADPAREEVLKYKGAAETESEQTENTPLESHMVINSEPYTVTAEEGFNNAGVTELICDATETYSFKSSSADTTWKVFVLDKKFEDGARYLPQAEKAALEGDGTLKIEEGKYIYILCSESNFTAEKASDAYLSINYASETDTSAQADASLAGDYQDSYSQRATATVTEDGSNIKIVVNWGSSAFENTVWEMTAVREGDRLVYNDCTKTEYENEDGAEKTEVEYKNGSGYFTVQDGKLLWNGAAEDDCVSCVFEK